MATLLFAAAGSALGGAIGGSILGVSSAAIGQALGATLGRMVDASLFGPTQKVEGPRLDSLSVQTSEEGAPLPCVEGRGRVAGVVIWATRLREVVSTTKTGGKGAPQPKVESTEYRYYASFAVALSDCTTGPITHVGRVWADGKQLDPSQVQMRVYHGTETQAPDPLIVAKEGSAPAYRGLAYAVLEELDVTDFGRRIPNMQFEVWGPSGEMEQLVRGVDLIPGATEFGYSPGVIEAGGAGETKRENAVRGTGSSDWSLAMAQLGATLPNCGTVALVVSWFGTDLRAGHCRIEPRVEIAAKETSRAWQVAGVARDQATLVSYVDGKPAFGSAPDDQSVIEAIQDLKARGYRVVLYPFIMMDIPAGNSLPDPETGLAGQPVYPWRGRIRPTAGSSVATEVASFVGSATPGANEWSYRRFILHLAGLAQSAGGVDAFLIGTEMVSLTTATDAPGSYPFVDALVTLAADVKAMLPGSQISYAADWSEYHSHRAGGEVFFHLDPLWACADVDFVGIDNYLPLSDWRGGTAHLDYGQATSVYALDYLKGQIEGGEYWDFYYASEADRAAQIRTPIEDLGHGEHWIFRQKAIRDWWASAHHPRPGGLRSGAPTAWVPGSKPVWFTEFGCPAIHLGTNQPNVFYDPKSSESFFPHHSTGARDDFIQRQYLRAMCEWWRDNGGACVDPANMLAWAWDARPWPEFPHHQEIWSDGSNWRRGHWLNGRAGAAPAAELLQRRLTAHYGIEATACDVTECYGQSDGQVLDGPATFREVLAPWETLLRLDVAEHGGTLRIAARAAAAQVVDLSPEDLVEGEAALYQLTRSSLEETPRAATLRFADIGLDYQVSAARAAIRDNPGLAEARADLALVSDLDRMTQAAQTMLRAAADRREGVELTLPPSSPVRPGQVIRFTPRAGQPLRFVAEEVIRGAARKLKGTLYSDAVYGAAPGPNRPAPALVAAASTSVRPYLMDLPLLPGIEMEDHQGLAAFHGLPWPGGADLYRSTDAETGFGLALRAGLAATTGETVADLAPGVPARWSPEALELRLTSGALITRPEIDVFAGANALAVAHPCGWEVLQFQKAELVAQDTWRLTRLLRGQLGTEGARGAAALPSGARVVLLDAAVAPVEMGAGDVGLPFHWRAVPAGSDPAAVTPFTHSFTGAARRPYAPAHLRAVVVGNSVTLTWIRRTRIEGDTWPEFGDVPLGETAERYLVELGPPNDQGAAPLASQEVTSPTATLDLTGIPLPQEIRVAQISESYGVGSSARAVI